VRALREWLRALVAHITDSRVLADAFTATYEGPADNEPPQVAAWHSAIYDAALPLLTAARDAGAIRSDLSLMELMALTAAVARAGDPAHPERFLGILLEGIVPPPAAEHADDPHTPQDEGVSLAELRLTQAAGDPLAARGAGSHPPVVPVRVLPARHPPTCRRDRWCGQCPTGDMPDFVLS
jgi:hypothetical protein